MRLFPERVDRARRWFLWALLLSLALHLVSGSLWASLVRTLKPPPEKELAARTERITIENLPPPPTPTPVPTPTPRPVSTPTPAPTPTPRQRLLTQIAPHAATKRTVSQGVPHRPAQRRPSATVKAPPVHVAMAPPVVARHTELARPHAPGHRAPSALNPQQIAALDSQFSQTIAQAQHAVAQGPPTSSPAGIQTVKRYNPILDGNPQDLNLVTGGGTCVSLDDPRVHGPYIYYDLSCRTTYSDGFVEQVVFPWQFKFPVRDNPMVNGRRFPVQPPPDGFSLPDPFPMSRMVCDFYRARCQAIIARERANGTADLYGKPP